MVKHSVFGSAPRISFCSRICVNMLIYLRYSHPQPNFGLFLIKSNVYSVKAFKHAWKYYLKADNSTKYKVAIGKRGPFPSSHPC
jgi:hypothetical protein